PETVAWAVACGGDHGATALSQRLSEADVTPRLLQALGGAGYAEAIPFLLHFISDQDMDRADAASASLAAITGVDLVEPPAMDDAANENWCRSADLWRATLKTAFASRHLDERMVRGESWSSRSVERALADPAMRNGVRRTLRTRFGSARIAPTSYYWLQRGATN